MAQSKKCFEYSEKLTKYYSALRSYKIKRHLSSFFFLLEMVLELTFIGCLLYATYYSVCSMCISVNFCNHSMR